MFCSKKLKNPSFFTFVKKRKILFKWIWTKLIFVLPLCVIIDHKCKKNALDHKKTLMGLSPVRSSCPSWSGHSRSNQRKRKKGRIHKATGAFTQLLFPLHLCCIMNRFVLPGHQCSQHDFAFTLYCYLENEFIKHEQLTMKLCMNLCNFDVNTFPMF